jgi:hypothetical protein
MNKFTETLTQSNSKIKAARATIISASAEDAQTEILRNKKKTVRDLEFRLLNLTDIAPDSELSLRVTKADFNAESLFSEIHGVKVKLAMAVVEENIAEETYTEWFGVETTKAKTK